jgi:flagellar motor component MotA
MKLKFLLSIILTAAALILVKLMSGSWWTMLIDTPSFILVGIVPLIYQLLLFGFKNLKNAFSSPFKKESSEVEVSKSFDFFKTYNKSVWMFSAAAFLIGVISMLIHLEHPSMIGPNMAVAILPFLYAALINLFLILPYMVIAKQRLGESEIVL